MADLIRRVPPAIAGEVGDEASGRGTGFGGAIKLKTEAVKRFVGHTRDTLTVRYERPPAK